MSTAMLCLHSLVAHGEEFLRQEAREVTYVCWMSQPTSLFVMLRIQVQAFCDSAIRKLKICSRHICRDVMLQCRAETTVAVTV
jgi:hypothetical protein